MPSPQSPVPGRPGHRALGTGHFFLLALLALAGCGDEGPTTPDSEVQAGGPFLSAPVTLPVLGQGAISARYSAELWVRGETAYTTTWGNRGGVRGNAIYRWAVGGAQPVLRDSIIVPGAGTLGDVEVSADGRYLYAALEPAPGGAFLIYDVSGSGPATLVQRYAAPSVRLGVHTAEVEQVAGKTYAFLSIDPSGEVPAQLVVLDISNPASPVEVFAQAMGRPFVHDVFVRDGTLFTANWDDGLVIWSVGAGGLGSPASPVRLGTVATVGGNVHNVWWFHDPGSGQKKYAFVGEEAAGSGNASAGDVHVVDVSDPRNPKEVAFFTVPGAGTHNFWVDEARGVLYAAYYGGGVRALNVRGDLSTCTDAQKSDADHTTGTTMLCDLQKMGRAVGVGLTEAGRNANVWGVHQVGDALYASDMNNGLWKLDLGPLYRALGR